MMKRFFAVVGVLLVSLSSAFASDRVRGERDLAEPVVIVARFAPPGNLPCEAPEIDENTAGFGAWYVGAPCQRVTQNPGQPSCWQDDEDPCLIFSNGGTLTEDGKCPDTPCKAEYVVDITFVEPCTPPCNAVQCCASGVLKVTDRVANLGFLLDGQTKTFNADKECTCDELDDHSCIVGMEVQCQELGAYYHELAEFGYAFTCKKCQ